MKTTERNHLSSLKLHTVLLFLFTVGAASGDTPKPVATPKNEPKTHALFMGADFQVSQGKNLYRVRNVAGGSFIIDVDGKEVRVSMDDSPVKLKIDQALKLTVTSATIEKLQTERAYTPGTDPRRQWMAAQASAMGDSDDNMSRAGANLANNPQFVQRPTGPMGAMVETPNPGYASAQANFNSARSRNTSDMGSAAWYAQKLQDALALGLFDAVEVKFDVSAEKPLKAPYVVLVAQFHEKDKPKDSQNWIYATSLDPIDAKATSIRILQGGFPPGFEMEKFNVHLYDNGTEIATNVADKRVMLTREEAFQYLVIDYISSHKGATLQATPAMAKVPADWATRSKDEAAIKTCFVKVDKTGHPTGAYEDGACTRTLTDTYFEAVVMEVRFRPALAQGKAIESTVPLKFSHLSKLAL